MLSLKEAERFVNVVLKIPRTSMKSRQKDPRGFLNQLVLSFHETIPFQSITACSQLKAKDQHLPSLGQIKQMIMSTQGGVCYHMNTFMKFLLQTLGYEAFHIAANPGRVPAGHIATLVQNLKVPGDRYLVEVGCGYPTFEAVVIDFDKESPIYKHSFLEYKFVREGQDGLVRYHRVGGVMPIELDTEAVKGWRRFLLYDLTPRQFEYFNEPMEKLAADWGPTRRRLNLLVGNFRNQKATFIKDMSLLVEDNSCILQETKLPNHDAVLRIVAQSFPKLYPFTSKALVNSQANSAVSNCD